MPIRVPFEQLAEADLTVDAQYGQGPTATVGSEPLHRILPGVGNQGGFRASGRPSAGLSAVRYAVLFTSFEDPDWPDRLDEQTGLFTYFGDNKKPGSELHVTPRHGNRLLRDAFEALHHEPPEREAIPPFFVFAKATRGGNRDVAFLGLAVPGSRDVAPGQDLVAIWRSSGGARFQNYRAAFTVLDVGTVSRAWIAELQAGTKRGPHCPEPFKTFIEHGVYRPLESAPQLHYRTVAAQTPEPGLQTALVVAVVEHFADDAFAFEAFAMELWKLAAKEAVDFMEGTRRTADGGRDAIGTYCLGPAADQIKLRFSLEAKCYAPSNTVGVRDTARLISRLRHREFGVLVTTSAVAPQAYKEVRSDEHPLVIIAGRDIAELLIEHGYGSVDAVKAWLSANFPTDSQPDADRGAAA